MKKIFFALLLSLVIYPMSVWAAEDYVWVPEEPFYTEHAEECTTIGREYYANGPNGQVIVYESPASSKVIKTVENGDIIVIDYVYTNAQGITWGFCEFQGKFGWLPMPYMVLVYDGICFEEEYGEQIVEETGEALEGEIVEAEDLLTMHLEFAKTDRRIRFWTYPGSSSRYTVKVTSGITQNLPMYIKTFTDEDGRKWGFVSFFRGQTINRWICMNSIADLVAEHETLYPDGAPERDKRVIQPYEGEEIFPDDYEQVQMMKKVKAVSIALSVVVVIVIGSLFYWKMWKKVKQA